MQFLEQRLDLDEIGRVKAFGEPAINWREEIAGLTALALVAPEPGQAAGGAEFPQLGALTAGDRHALVEACFDVLHIGFWRVQLHLTVNAMHLGFRPPRLRRLNCRKCLPNDLTSDCDFS